MTEERKACYNCFMLHYYKRPYAKYLHNLNWRDEEDLGVSKKEGPRVDS